MNGLDHPATLQTWDTHLMKSLLSLLIQTGRRVKCCEKPDTKWNRPCTPRAVLTLGLQGATMTWHCPGTCHGVMKCRNMATLCERVGCWLLSATMFERKAVCSSSSLGWALPFTPQLEFCFKLHRCITFFITQAKHLPLRIKNVTQTIDSSVQPFLFSFLPTLLPLFYYFQPFLANILIFNNISSKQLLTTVITFKN